MRTIFPTSKSLDRAVNDCSGAPLSNNQKRDVTMLARRVWEKLGLPGFAGQPVDIPDAMRLSVSEAFTLWRQNEQGIAAGHEHLTACTQRHYPLLIAHFARLGGNDGLADRWIKRAVGDPIRQARYVLEREFGRVADVIDRPSEYVASIARSRFKTMDLTTLSARQLWSLLYDLRRNAQRRRAKQIEPAALHFVTSPTDQSVPSDPSEAFANSPTDQSVPSDPSEEHS